MSTPLYDQETVLFFFRKVIYAIYLEIGALQPQIHPHIAEKADLKNAFFQREKERHAAALYHQVEAEIETEKILQPFQERTGLTLEDVHRAFAEGNWQNKFGGYNFGGPRWARIVELALELRQKIDAGAWEEAALLVLEGKGLKTNQGYLVHVFDRTERRR